MQKLGRAYFDETKWLYNNFYVPTLDDYLKVALVTSGYMMASTTSLVGMGDQVSKKDFDWIINEPLIVQAASVICRLTDDLVGDQFEQKPSSQICYMKQYGVPEEEARAQLKQQVRNAWKDINQECLEPRPASMSILMRVVNLARVINLLYSDTDCYTDPNKSKAWVKMVLIEPVV